MSFGAPKSRPEVPDRKRATFPRTARLLRHADFERVYKQGRRHFAAHMTVFYLLQPEATAPRVGLTVGKLLGGAVKRNRMKRRLREAIRPRLPEFRVPVDVVVNPKQSILQVDFSELGDEIGRAFEVIRKYAEKRNS